MEERIKSLEQSVENMRIVLDRVVSILEMHSERIDIANKRIDILRGKPPK